MVRLGKAKTKESSKLGKEQDQTSLNVGCKAESRQKRVVSPKRKIIADERKRLFDEDHTILILI